MAGPAARRLQTEERVTTRIARIVSSSCLLFVAGGALAQSVIRQGSEFQVNRYTTNHQYLPAVAADADGDFVVTWSSGGQDGPGTPGIFGARFDSAGAILGVEFQVNVYTTSIQTASAVAAEANGDFVVVWQSYHQDSGAGAGWGLFGRRFASDGTALGGEFQVNTYTTGFQVYPKLAADADGDFVVVWQSTGQDGAGGRGVFGQRFDSSGTPLAAEFLVNTYTPGHQARPSVASADDGDFVVAWESAGIDGSGNAVMLQRYDSAGLPQGAAFQANVHTNGSQSKPGIAAEADGDFVVAWQSLNQDGAAGTGLYGIFARRFSSAGAAQSGEVQVNVFTTGDQRDPAIAADDDGDFVVIWQSIDQDGSEAGVFARRIHASGAAHGPEFQVNSYTVGFQGETEESSAIGFDADGDFVIAWRNTEPQDGHLSGVFAQRFSLPPLATLDVDGNGALGALTDGLLYLRYRFGLTGAALAGGVIGAGCTRCDGPAVIAYLDGLGTTLDVDGNGGFSALTDGLLVVRFLFGLGGDALTSGVVGAGCTRCDAAAIVPYLQMLD
jgi:hypothetical protein